MAESWRAVLVVLAWVGCGPTACLVDLGVFVPPDAEVAEHDALGADDGGPEAGADQAGGDEAGGGDDGGPGASDAAPDGLEEALEGCAGGCEDGDPCTEDACLGGQCAHSSASPGAACDDGDLCTAGDACRGDGTCGGEALDCDDGDACTLDACAAGACTHDPVTGPCDDGDPCTTADVCADGVCAGVGSCAPPGWTATTPLPFGRGSFDAVAYDGRLYAIAGSADVPAPWRVADVDVAAIAPDGALGAWQPTAPTPSPLDAHAAVVADGYLFVLGGAKASSQGTAEVHAAPILADGTLGSWAATTPLIHKSQGHGAVVHGGYVYVAGGDDGGGGFDVEVWRAAITAPGTLGPWEAQTPFPVGRYACQALVASAGALYVAGDHAAAGPLATVRFALLAGDGTLGAWTATTPLPAPVHGHGVVLSGDHLLSIAGANGPITTGAVHAAPVAPSGAIGAWDGGVMDPLPVPATGFAVATWAGFAYVLGGATEATPHSDLVHYAPLPW